jgi:hypothetical protein
MDEVHETSAATAREDFLALKSRMGKSIIEQEAMIERLLLGLVANGHLLVEGLPGLAKTRAVKALAKNLDAQLSRIQFTPDLLPSDITGSDIYFSDGGKSAFKFQQGPIFANLILADEVNRASAKVQAALLEAMKERQVTVGGTTASVSEARRRRKSWSASQPARRRRPILRRPSRRRRLSRSGWRAGASSRWRSASLSPSLLSRRCIAGSRRPCALAGGRGARAGSPWSRPPSRK